jgi:hypothetical protein
MIRLRIIWHLFTKKNFIFIGWTGNPDQKLIPEGSRKPESVMYTSDIEDYKVASASLDRAKKVFSVMDNETK